MIAPIDRFSFADAISRTKTPVLVPGPSEKFDELFNSGAFWASVAKGKPEGVPVPTVSHTRYKLPLAFEKGAIDRALRSGSTVCVSHIDRASESLRQLCLDVESALGFPGSACVHCYISPPGTGYDFFHVDAGAAVTLQLAGTKTWEYSEQAAVPWCTISGGYREESLEWSGDTDWQPAIGRFPSPEDQGTVERALTPGDLLLVPPGVWHRVHSTDSTSISLNLKLIHRPSVDALLRVVRQACLDDEFWRSPLPFASDGELHSGLLAEETRSALQEQLLRLSEVIQDIANDEAAVSRTWFRTFLGSQDEVIGTNRVDIGRTDVLEIPPRVVPRLAVSSDGSMALLGRGKTMHLRGGFVAPLLREILKRRNFRVDAVESWPSAGVLDARQIEQTLKALVRSGFLRVVDSERTVQRQQSQ